MNPLSLLLLATLCSTAAPFAPRPPSLSSSVRASPHTSLVTGTAGRLVSILSTSTDTDTVAVANAGVKGRDSGDREKSVGFDNGNWDFVDEVVLITTDRSSSERLQRTRLELEAVGLWGRVTVRTFEADNEDRVRGCYTSHIKVLQELQEVRRKKEGRDLGGDSGDKGSNAWWGWLQGLGQWKKGSISSSTISSSGSSISSSSSGSSGSRRGGFRALVLEDNLECTQGMSAQVLRNVAAFLDEAEEGTEGVGAGVAGTARGSEKGEPKEQWDVFHLAYMMYVPGLNLRRLDGGSVVQMITEPSAAVGTSAYLISGRGIDRLLQKHKEEGFTDAIPNVMTELFPDSRFAAYPMVFHRAGGVGSLVNPQLDDFRKIMFSPALYSNWERLMVGTGLQNNQLFPALLGGLVVTLLLGVLNASSPDLSAVTQVLALFPLLVALWGASLFKTGSTGSTGAGFAKSSAKTSNGE